MKRITSVTVFTIAILLILVALTIPSQPVTGSITPIAHCMNCADADTACKVQRNDRYYSCIITSGPSVTVEDCYKDAEKYYWGCMAAWGCGVKFPTSNPGDN